MEFPSFCVMVCAICPLMKKKKNSGNFYPAACQAKASQGWNSFLFIKLAHDRMISCGFTGIEHLVFPVSLRELAFWQEDANPPTHSSSQLMTTSLEPKTPKLKTGTWLYFNCHVFQVTHLFDNGGTVFFAIFMAIWGKLSGASSCLSPFSCFHQHKINEFPWLMLKKEKEKKSPVRSIYTAFASALQKCKVDQLKRVFFSEEFSKHRRFSAVKAFLGE